jgi:diguanylate cyclase (GGDEF)-like protein
MIDRLLALAGHLDTDFMAIAALVCMTSSLTAVRLFARGFVARGEARPVWLILAGLAAGFGAWSTHFLAMLGYDPGVASGHGPVGLLASMVLVLLMATATFYSAANLDGWIRPVFAGIIFAFAMMLMHFSSMDDFHVRGEISNHRNLVGMAFASAALLAVAGFTVIGTARLVWRQALGGLLLGGAVCAFQLFALAAIKVMPVSGASASGLVISNTAIAVSIAAVTLIVIATGLGAVLIDAQASERAVQRLRRLADGAFEGIVITTNGRIVDANNSFLDLVGAGRDEIVGRPVDKNILERGHSETGTDDALLSPIGVGEPIPVEVRSRTLSDDRAEAVYAIRDLRAQRKAEEEIRYLAQHDAATRLLNRNAFMSRLDALLDRAQHESESVALLFIDLDLFKAVNDVHGHRAGDHVIARIADRLRDFATPSTIVGRVGGDEFIVALYGGPQPTEAAQRAHALLDMLQQPIAFDEHRLDVSASIGVSLFPADAGNAGDLVAFADMALYRAKKGGRNAVCFFSRDMDEAVRDRRRLARDLKKGIDNDELMLSYQPLAAMADGRVVGFEALVRWRHPTRGLLQPDDFILVAEENGLIVPLGNWVLQQACAEAAGWERPFRVAVNLSAIHLQDSSLVARVHETLVNTGLPPSRLEIEITESALFLDQARALSNLRRLKALGVRIAMDDFGTGYSSLSTLNAFPFDRIKIDRSFVEEISWSRQAEMIVRAIVSLGHSLGVPITAEGVETQAQFDFLRNEGCDQVQGFLIGRPEDIAAHADCFLPTVLRADTVAKAS